MTKKTIFIKWKSQPTPKEKLTKQKRDFSFLISKYKNFVESQLKNNPTFEEMVRRCFVDGSLVDVEVKHLVVNGTGVACGIVYGLADLIASQQGLPSLYQHPLGSPEHDEIFELHRQIWKVVAHILYHSEIFKSMIEDQGRYMEEYFMDLAKTLPKRFVNEVYDELLRFMHD